MPPNRTEILHFRATPEEKARIKENAGHAEVALSTWMRERSLAPATPVMRIDNEVYEVTPVLRGAQLGADPTQPAVEFDPRSVEGGEVNVAELGLEDAVPLVPGETYEQFMERRVGELVGDGESTLAIQDAATVTAEREWRERQ